MSCAPHSSSPYFSFFSVAGNAGTTRYVDDDAPNDPGPNDPSISDPLEDGSPDHPFDMIQEAITATSDGDTVIVLPGFYLEDISFNGKAIIVKSEAGPGETIIHGSQLSTVTFKFGEHRDSVIDGFTIKGGSGTPTPYGNCGGGIYCFSGNALVANCTLWNNTAEYVSGGKGGGITPMEDMPPSQTRSSGTIRR